MLLLDEDAFEMTVAGLATWKADSESAAESDSETLSRERDRGRAKEAFLEAEFEPFDGPLATPI